MFYYLFDYLSSFYHPLTALKALTLRAILSSVSALTITLCLGTVVIQYLSRLQVKQVVRSEGPKSHYAKSGTPTMGGVLILTSVIVSSIMWGKLTNFYLWITLMSGILFGAIGWIDDYRKLVLHNSKGLTARYKYAYQSIIGLTIAGLLYYHATPEHTVLLFPIFKDLGIQLGCFYIILSYFVIVGSSNAVNLTDGLDGLAIMPIILITGALGFIAYITGNHIFANYLHLPYITGVEELCIITSSIVGAGLGFLWFNSYPALIFMGDVGSLSLGALLGTIAIIVRQELLLFIMGGIFVAETISVILQVASFKLTAKRIFRMAPIHHHFELKGWPEPRVIVRFWIITVILVLFGLITLKLR